MDELSRTRFIDEHSAATQAAAKKGDTKHSPRSARVRFVNRFIGVSQKESWSPADVYSWVSLNMKTPHASED
jgi:hypothetical protein